MWTISKRFDFSASHVLHGLPDGHQCGRLHGHNYSVEVELSGDRLDELGFVVDYGELAPFRDWLDRHVEHRHLNESLPGITNPTAERIAASLHSIACQTLAPLDGFGSRWGVAAVRVYETPKTCAEYRP